MNLNQTQCVDNIKHQPFVISGCSGVGKGTLVRYLLDKHPQIFELSVSYTTRQKRNGEQHGRQYYFVSRQQFQKEIQNGSFTESGLIHDNYYGTYQSQVQSIIGRGKICILEVDLVAGLKIFNKMPDSIFLFVEAPCVDILQERLRKRGTQIEQKIVQRMKKSIKELEQIEKLQFYNKLINDNLQVTKKQLISFLNMNYRLNLKE